MRLSELICDLIDAKMEVADFQRENTRNRCREERCERRLSEAKDKLDDALRDYRAEGICIATARAMGHGTP